MIAEAAQSQSMLALQTQGRGGPLFMESYRSSLCFISLVSVLFLHKMSSIEDVRCTNIVLLCNFYLFDKVPECSCGRDGLLASPSLLEAPSSSTSRRSSCRPHVGRRPAHSRRPPRVYLHAIGLFPCPPRVYLHAIGLLSCPPRVYLLAIGLFS